MPSGSMAQLARLSERWNGWAAVMCWRPEVILGAHALHMLLLGDFGYYYIKPSAQTNVGFRQRAKLCARCNLVRRDLLPESVPW